jgi:hypothetical protein
MIRRKTVQHLIEIAEGSKTSIEEQQKEESK